MNAKIVIVEGYGHFSVWLTTVNGVPVQIATEKSRSETIAAAKQYLLEALSELDALVDLKDREDVRREGRMNCELE